MEAFERIKKIMAEIEEDVQKGAGGNKAAQTRVRKAMQEIKDAAQQVRVGMLEARGGGDSQPAAGGKKE